MVPVLLPPHPSLALRYSQYFAPFLNSSLFALGSNHPFCRGSSLGGPAGAALSPRDFMCASFLSFYPPAARGAGEREKKPGKEVKRKVGGETSLASFDMSRARCEEEGEGEMAGRRRRLLPPPPLPRGTMGEERKGGASEGGRGGRSVGWPKEEEEMPQPSFFRLFTPSLAMAVGSRRYFRPHPPESKQENPFLGGPLVNFSISKPSV